MRRLLLTSLLLAGSSAAALAADLPARRAPPVFVPPPPAFTWTGGYFGVNAGYAFDNYARNSLSPAGAAAVAGIEGRFVPAYTRSKSNGFTGGGQVGYNYEIEGPGLAGLPVYGGLPAGVVLGVEADAAYTDLRSNNNFIGAAGVNTRLGERTEFVGTARARLGLALGTVLIYGTGGFAYGGVNTAGYVFAPAGTAGYAGYRSKIGTGGAYGGGVEYAIPTASFLNFFNSSAVTVKVEYLHYELGTTSVFVRGFTPVSAGSAFVDRVRVEGNLVRAGLNFKFGTPVVPVVARY